MRFGANRAPPGAHLAYFSVGKSDMIMDPLNSTTFYDAFTAMILLAKGQPGPDTAAFFTLLIEHNKEIRDAYDEFHGDPDKLKKYYNNEEAKMSDYYFYEALLKHHPCQKKLKEIQNKITIKNQKQRRKSRKAPVRQASQGQDNVDDNNNHNRNEAAVMEEEKKNDSSRDVMDIDDDTIQNVQPETSASLVVYYVPYIYATLCFWFKP